jgi:hypothetical protein
VNDLDLTAFTSHYNWTEPGASESGFLRPKYAKTCLLVSIYSKFFLGFLLQSLVRNSRGRCEGGLEGGRSDEGNSREMIGQKGRNNWAGEDCKEWGGRKAKKGERGYTAPFVTWPLNFSVCINLLATKINHTILTDYCKTLPDKNYSTDMTCFKNIYIHVNLQAPIHRTLYSITSTYQDVRLIHGRD